MQSEPAADAQQSAKLPEMNDLRASGRLAESVMSRTHQKSQKQTPAPGESKLERRTSVANMYSTAIATLCLKRSAHWLSLRIQSASYAASPAVSAILQAVCNPPAFLQPVFKLSAAVFFAVLCGIVITQCLPASWKASGQQAADDNNTTMLSPSAHAAACAAAEMADGNVQTPQDALPGYDYASTFASPASASSSDGAHTRLSPPVLADMGAASQSLTGLGPIDSVATAPDRAAEFVEQAFADENAAPDAAPDPNAQPPSEGSTEVCLPADLTYMCHISGLPCDPPATRSA